MTIIFFSDFSNSRMDSIADLDVDTVSCKLSYIIIISNGCDKLRELRELCAHIRLETKFKLNPSLLPYDCSRDYLWHLVCAYEFAHF